MKRSSTSGTASTRRNSPPENEQHEAGQDHQERDPLDEEFGPDDPQE